MKAIILKVVEGRGKTGNAKTGKKRFLFTDDSMEKLDYFIGEYHSVYKEMYPQGKQDFKSIKKQFTDLILKHQDVELMEYEIEPLKTTLAVGNMTKLNSQRYINAEATLQSFAKRIENGNNSI